MCGVCYLLVVAKLFQQPVPTNARTLLNIGRRVKKVYAWMKQYTKNDKKNATYYQEYFLCRTTFGRDAREDGPVIN